MVKAIETWVVVADGTRAQVLRNAGPGRGLEELPGALFEGPNLRDAEVMSDRPGRAFDSHGQGRHAMEYGTPPKQHERQLFARRLADWLNDPRRSKKFDRLAVIAAPKVLGDLRGELSDAVQAKIICEIDKDLTRANPEAIAAALAERIAL